MKFCGAQALAICSMSRLTLGGKKRAGGRVHRDRRADESDAVNSLLGKRYQTSNMTLSTEIKPRARDDESSNPLQMEHNEPSVDQTCNEDSVPRKYFEH